VLDWRKLPTELAFYLDGYIGQLLGSEARDIDAPKSLAERSLSLWERKEVQALLLRKRL
jgi:hypothetical protein